MDNTKNNLYFLEKMISDLKYSISLLKEVTFEEFENNQLLIDSICFRIVQVSENSNRLSKDLIEKYSGLPFRVLKGLRNRIVHDYGAVNYLIVFETAKNDLPQYLDQIYNIKNDLLKNDDKS